MLSEHLTAVPLLARDRYTIFEFISDLWNGEPMGWLALGLIAGLIGFFVIYKQLTGEDFVKSRKERREARRKRKHVVWEYQRDE